MSSLLRIVSLRANGACSKGPKTADHTPLPRINATPPGRMKLEEYTRSGTQQNAVLMTRLGSPSPENPF